MLAVGHTAIGIAIGLAVPEPAAAFGLGVISHHLADAIPHFDAGSFLLEKPWHPRYVDEFGVRDWLIVGIDTGLTLSLLVGALMILPKERWLVVGAGVLGALLPDLVHNVPFWSPNLRKVGWIRFWQDQIHRRFHWTVPVQSWPLGIGTQLAALGVAFWSILKVRS